MEIRKRRRFLDLIASRSYALVGVLILASTAQAQLPAVQITEGALRATMNGAVATYLGVPYAASTAGANRWRPPQPPAPWSGARAATAFGLDCQQDPPYQPPGGSPWTPEYMPSGPMSEDCLFLNVWTAAKRANAKLPVMMWIHGGGFAGGSGAVPIYNGASLARRGLVVVTINYRVSVFGFFAYPALTKEAGTSGNYGLLDQIAALQWVKRNIAAFGGDPENVTIAGQSAGAASVHALIASPLARGLFHRAIAQSGSGMGLATPALADAEKSGERLASVLGAASLPELRALPPEKLTAAIGAVKAGQRLRFGLVRDSVVLPDPAATLSEVPVLTGMNADEASVDAGEWNPPDEAALLAEFKRRFGDQAPALAELYATGIGSHPRSTAHEMLRDRGIAAMLQWAKKRPSGSPPVFSYLYTHIEPGTDAARFGVFHTSEVPYVFDTLEARRPFVAQDRRIAEMMGAYWINFMKTGNPNGVGLTRWPDFASGQLMELGEHFIPRSALTAKKISVYQAYVDAGGQLGLF